MYSTVYKFQYWKMTGDIFRSQQYANDCKIYKKKLKFLNGDGCCAAEKATPNLLRAGGTGRRVNKLFPAKEFIQNQ